MAPSGRSRWFAALAVAALAIVVLAIVAVRHLLETPPSAPLETRVDIVTPATDNPTSFALSPDGRQIVFVASSDGVSRLWLRSLATTTAQPLAGTEGATFSFWAPNGRAVAFFAASELKRIDVGGGVPQTLATAPSGRGGAWHADGFIVFAPNLTTPLMRVSATGGAAVPITTLGPQQTSHRWPHLLPDGRRFLFYAQAAPDGVGIHLGALDGGTPVRLTPSDSAGLYLPAGPAVDGAVRGDGWLLWARAGTLVGQRLDVAQAVLTGDLVTLADGVTLDIYNRSAFAVSATGLVAYRTGEGHRRQLTWVDRSGTARGTVGVADGSMVHPRVSADGRVAVVRMVQGNNDLWLLEGDRTSRVTFDAAFDFFPLWSPDGSRIAFNSNRAGPYDLYLKLTSGAGIEERLETGDQSKFANSWTKDGRFLLYHRTDSQTGTDLWVLPMVGDRKPMLFLKTPFVERWGAFSPDGQWVAYQSDESGRAEIYVRPFVPPGATETGPLGGQWQISAAGGVYPAWRPDGKELYYLNPAGVMMAATVTVTRSTLQRGTPVTLFPTRILGGVDGWQYDVAPDGRFLINTVLDGTAAPITLLQNWHPGRP